MAMKEKRITPNLCSGANTASNEPRSRRSVTVKADSENESELIRYVICLRYRNVPLQPAMHCPQALILFAEEHYIA